MDDILHMSLSDLLKQSAMQMCYLRKKNEKKPVTKGQIEGNKVAHAKSESKYMEMRGTYKMFNNLLIHYAFDEIQIEEKSTLLIEHKNIREDRPIELWYLQSSILQTAVYQAFVRENPSKDLYTATFYVKEGNPKLHLKLNNNYLRSELRMGDDHYSVVANDAKALVEFYCNKALATLNYESAKSWDAQYKHKEFHHLFSNFVYRQISHD